MIPFQKRDSNTILKEFIQDAQNQKLLSDSIDYESLITENKDIENVFVLLLNIWSQLLSEVYTDMEDVKKGYDITTATGQDLDNLGLLKGIHRPEATSPCAELVFTLQTPLTSIITLDEPIIVSTSDGIRYQALTSITLDEGTSSFKLVSYALNKGPTQRVSSNKLTHIETDLPFTCTVNNPESATGGTETSTDTEYRTLLLNSHKIHEKGTRWAFRHYLDNYPGLDSYNLIPMWDGTGTIKVIVDVNDDTSTIINQITQDLKDNVMRADDALLVQNATRIELTINLTINVDLDRLNPYSTSEKQDIKARITQAIYNYVNGDETSKGLVIGDDFIPYKLGVYLDTKIPEIKNINITNPTEPVTVANEEIAHINMSNIKVVIE